jgi:hypothetical protein
MAHGVFPRVIRFAEGAAEGLVVKQRIVSESVRATRSIYDAAFHGAAKSVDELATAHQSDRANESG